jgi:phage FluMu gp28-like protein
MKHKIDSDSILPHYFMPHQIQWILAEKPIHDQGKQAVALAEKSIRIGWTYADAFKNVRKRLLFRNRDYLFATKDYPSALEYIQQCYKFAELFHLTSSITSHGEETMSVNQLDQDGHPSCLVEQVKIGLIKFDNGSRIIAFSSNPQAMAVHGGDVGLDEFAKHPNAKLLWETAQGRAALGHDLAVWSAHDGEDTLFNEFAQEARNGAGPWNIYFKVTMMDAIKLGLVDFFNRIRGTCFNQASFLASCKARARLEEIFQQAYMCNPLGAATNHIVDWSSIARCQSDYQIERLHLEADQVRQQFGEFVTCRQLERENKIHQFLRASFPSLFAAHPLPSDGRGIKGEGDSSRSTLHAPRFASASKSPPAAPVTSPSSTSTKSKAPNSGSGLCSPVALKTGTSLKPSCSISFKSCQTFRPPAMKPASAAKSAGKPPKSTAAGSFPPISPPKNLTSALPL